MSGHGGPRYDDQWADVLDAEKWALTRHQADLMRRAYRLAAYFPHREPPCSSHS